MYPQPGVEIFWRLPRGQLHHTVSWNNSPNGLSLILKHEGGGAQYLQSSEPSEQVAALCSSFC